MEDEISRSISIAMKTTSKFFPPGKKTYPTFTNTSDLKPYSVLGMKNSFQERKISNFHKHFRSQTIFCSWHEELLPGKKNIQLSQTLQISIPFFWHEELLPGKKNIQLSQTVQISNHILFLA